MNTKKNLFVIIIFIFIISIFLLITENARSANEVNTSNPKVDNVNQAKVPEAIDDSTKITKGQGNEKSEGSKSDIAVNENDKEDSGKEEDKNFLDFNDDGVIDARDVNIMQNMLNMSLQQAISLMSSLTGQNLWFALPQSVEALPVNLNTQVLTLIPQHQNSVIIMLGEQGNLEGQINLGTEESKNKEVSSVPEALSTTAVLSKNISDADRFKKNDAVADEVRKKLQSGSRGSY